jgi:hypothetical protein
MTPTFRRMAAVLTSTVAMTMMSGALPLIAQETGKGQAPSTAKKTGKRAGDPTRRVPNYFAQLGLSDAQRESIYQIQARHQPKIDALEKQLEDLRAQALKECEGVLSAAQKEMLSERRAKAAETRTKRGGSGSGDAAKPKG